MFSFFSDVVNALGQVINFFKALFELIETTIQFIPQPFLSITLLFTTILTASLLYKVIKR